MKFPPIQVVDKDDTPIGEASMETVYGQGLIYRVVFVIVEDENGRILLQKRSNKVGTFQGRWDASAGGHVDAGEDYDQAAHRETAEELGLLNLELEEIRYSYNHFTADNTSYQRFFKTYRTVISPDSAIKFNPDEISAVRWFAAEEVGSLIKNEPEKVAAGLVESLGDYENHVY